MKQTSPNTVETLEEYNRVHETRWRMSIDWIKENIPIQKNWSVLEVARSTQLSINFKMAFGIKPDQTEFDVRDRFEWEDLDSGPYDLVINTEVIEHLPDWGLPEESGKEPAGEMLKSGILNCLAGCHRVLKPGGYMFLTTPNTSSIMVLASWIYYNSPFNWDRHVREHSFHQAVDLVRQVGFEVLKATTEDPYLHVHDEKKRRYFQWLSESLGAIGAPRENRGETTFIVARKPS